MAPKGELYILINLYRDNHYSLRWVEELKMPVQVRSEQEYIEMLKRHTFEDVRAVRVPDLTPTPEEYSGRWFKNAEELRDFKRIGALLLIARKPDFEVASAGVSGVLRLEKPTYPKIEDMWATRSQKEWMVLSG